MSGLSSISVVVSFFATIIFCVIAIKNRKVDKAVYKKGMRYAGISFVIMIVSTFGVEEADKKTTESNQEIQGNVAQSNAEAEKAEAAAKAEAEAEAKAKADEEARLKAEAEAAAEKAQAEAAAAAAKAEEEAKAKAEAEAVAKAKAEEQAKAQVAQQQQASAARESFQNCTEMRKVYPSGVESSHPAYASKHDRDKDGWACE